MPIAIYTSQLERTYQVGERAVRALRGVNLAIPAGQFIALKGRSGSGKTTLLNCLGGLDKATSGEIRIYDQPISTLTDSQMTHWRRKQVGFNFQSFGLLPTLSAYENVEMMLRIAGIPGRERSGRTQNCLEMVGLTKWQDHRPYELSGGQQQRVAIARAIAPHPQLSLADEATGELDTETTHQILNLFRQIVEQNQTTILLATHDPLADEYADQILHLRDGQIANN